MDARGCGVDVSLITADVQKQNSDSPADWVVREITPDDASRAVRDYLDTLYDVDFGAAMIVKPKGPARADEHGV